MPRFTIVFVLLGLVARAGGASAATSVTSCDVTLPPHAVGALTDDLQCGSHCQRDHAIGCLGDTDRVTCAGVGGDCVPDQIVLEAGAKLDLAGHTLRYAYPGEGVICGGSTNIGTCTVLGPGAIIGGQGSGILSPAMNVIARNLTIDGSHHAILSEGRVFVRNLTMGPNDANDIVGKRGIRASVVVPGVDGMTSEGDIVSDHVTLRDYSGTLLAKGTLRVRDLVFASEGLLEGRDLFIDRARPLDPSGAWHLSLTADRRLELARSRLAGDGGPAQYTGGELYSGQRPHLFNATCERSYRFPDSTSSWNVCRSD